MPTTARGKQKERRLANWRMSQTVDSSPEREPSLCRSDNNSPLPKTPRDTAHRTEQHNQSGSAPKLRNSYISFVQSADAATYKDDRNKPTPAQTPSPAWTPSVNSQESRAKYAAVVKDMDSAITLQDRRLSSKPQSSGRTRALDKANMKTDQGQKFSGGVDSHGEQNAAFFIDTHGDSRIKTDLPNPKIPSPSPGSASFSDSDSSIEVILFKGRNKVVGRGSGKSKKKATSSKSAIQPTQKLAFQMKSSHSGPSISAPKTSTLSSNKKDSHRARKTQKKAYPDELSDIDEDIAADYLANVRDFSASEHDTDTIHQPRSSEAHNMAGFTWNSDDLQDFGDLSTSSEMVHNVGKIYSKRVRSTGTVQYLVVGKDLPADEARWIRAELLTSVSAVQQLRIFEEKKGRMDRPPSSSEESTSDGPDNDEIIPSDEDDEKDFSTKVRSRMSDAEIARRLAKQAELGIDDDDIVMFDGTEDLELPGDDEEEELAEGSAFNTKYKGTKPAREFVRGEYRPPLDDGYGGFDVMDRDRPSLNTRSKKKIEQLESELSDLELEANLHSTWEKDRGKKKARKIEREQLRTLGIIGKGADKKLKAEYMKGPSIDQIKEQIKKFCLSDFESHQLETMPSNLRLMVHQICNQLGLDARSQGKDPNRFPVLFKKDDTPELGEWFVDSVLDSFPRKGKGIGKFQKNTRAGFNQQKSSKQAGSSYRATRGGGGSGVWSASYQDGEIVGATAPEIGVENKGRAMLERMGWSSGTALGALDNKGSLNFIQHVVKNSKAGLG